MTPVPSRPLVSVILPTRNRARFLARSVGSVFAQTYPELELIVVDDASTDATRDVLAQLAEPRLRVLHRETNHGAAAARNAGLAIARGELVAFLDDDDFWLVRKLERQVDALLAAGPAAGWCLAGYLRLDRRFSAIGGERHRQVLDYRDGMGAGDWSLIATPGWLVRRDVLASAGGFDERLRSWDDWELGLRLSAATGRVVLGEPLWVQDWMDGGGMARAERARADDLRLIMQKHAPLWARRPDVRAHHWYVIGRAESLYDPAPAGRDALRRSLRLRPLAPRTWAALAVSYLGQGRVAWLTRQARRLQHGLS